MLNINDRNALALMNANKCKFIHLSTYFEDVEEGTTFNIFVDTNKLFEGFRRSYQKPLVDKIVEERLDHNLAAEIMNWVVHYRRYFNRKNCITKFFFLHGNTALPDEWNTKYKAHHKYLNFVMEKRLRPLASLTPDIYVVNTNLLSAKIDGISIPYVISQTLKTLKNGHNLIISDDELAYQLLYQVPNTYLLKLSSDSLKVVKGNIFDYLSKSYKTTLKNIPDWYINIYLALIGVNDIPPISPKLKKLMILKGLATLYSDNFNEYSLTPEKIYNQFKDYIDLTELEFIVKYNERIVVIDNDRHLLSDTSEVLSNAIESQLLDGNQVDYKLLNDINVTHYSSLIETIIL